MMGCTVYNLYIILFTLIYIDIEREIVYNRQTSQLVVHLLSK